MAIRSHPSALLRQVYHLVLLATLTETKTKYKAYSTMHTSIGSLLTLLVPATLAIPRIRPDNSGTDASVIPSEVLYYYRYHHIPLDVYMNGLTNNMLLDEDQDAVTKAINEMACGPENLGICPSLQWYCNADMGKCSIKKLIGERCDSDISCFSGNCHSECMKSDGQFGAKCIDETRCNPGLVCRYGMYNRDHRQCLDMKNKIYGVSCTDNNDCESPLVCNEATIGGARNICSLPEDRTGSVMCVNDGDLCGADSQCCSNKCRVTAASRMPRCMA